MTIPFATRTSLGITWLIALAIALWVAIGTATLPAWAAVVLITLLPVIMMMVMSNTATKSVAEILRDVEAGR